MTGHGEAENPAASAPHATAAVQTRASCCRAQRGDLQTKIKERIEIPRVPAVVRRTKETARRPPYAS